MTSAKDSYAVVMFAHNEERDIANSIRSVLDNVDDRMSNLYVIANGCTDSTVSITQTIQMKETTRKITVIDLELGDKCNAWNYYTSEIASDETVHFFVDADVGFTKNAFPIMFDTLQNEDAANAVAGFPFSGRNIEYYRSLVTEKSCLFGNCYGLKLRFIKLLREKNQKLPIGLSWIDSAITKLVNSDVGNQYKSFPGRVTYNAQAGYTFRSLSPFKWHDVKLYFNRIARYQLGKLQERFLDELEFSEWPDNLIGINNKVRKGIKEGRLKSHFFLRWKIFRQIKKLEKSLCGIV